MSNIWKSFVLATLAALVGVIGFGGVVHAEGEEVTSTPRTEISISPTMSVVTMLGGDDIKQGSEKCPKDLEAGCAVEVKNTGDTQYRFRVHVTPYSVSGENNEVSFDKTNSSYSQIARWISFLDDNGNYVDEYIGVLGPGEARTVYYRIEVPDDVPGGAQYAAIWAQTISDNNGGTSVQTAGEAGMTIRGRSIGNTKRTGEITDYGFQRFSLGGNLEAHATVKNTGNTDYEIHYEYIARTVFGKELHSESGSIAAWPESEYHVDINWEDTPLLGIFNIEFAVSAADATRSEKQIVVIMPIFVIILLISLLTVIIIWIIIIIRKRKERKARTLV